jgi:hypothetical protein
MNGLVISVYAMIIQEPRSFLSDMLSDKYTRRNQHHIQRQKQLFRAHKIITLHYIIHSSYTRTDIHLPPLPAPALESSPPTCHLPSHSNQESLLRPDCFE